MTDGKLISGLDIGATKICCVIGRSDPQGQVTLLGVGCAPPTGLEKDTIVDLPSMLRAIARAVEEAEDLARAKTDSVFVGIAGEDLKGRVSRGLVALSREPREITARDVEAVVKQAKGLVGTRSDQEVIQAVPQEFIVDGQNGVRNPVGLYGSQLEADVYVVTGNVSPSLTGILDCVNEAGLEVEGVMVEPLAAGEAVLTPGEKSLGVVLIDFGGQTTNIAAFLRGNLAYTKTVSMGAERITLDIAEGLHVPPAKAEELKRLFGRALRTLPAESSVTARTKSRSRREAEDTGTPRRLLGEVIEPRVAELYRFVGREVRGKGLFEFIAAGVVLTGGGALLDGMPEVAHSFFNLPVRIGRPGKEVTGFGGLISDPCFSTAVGLVQCGARHRQLQSFASSGRRNPLVRLKEWLRRSF